MCIGINNTAKMPPRLTSFKRNDIEKETKAVVVNIVCYIKTIKEQSFLEDINDNNFEKITSEMCKICIGDVQTYIRDAKELGIDYVQSQIGELVINVFNFVAKMSDQHFLAHIDFNKCQQTTSEICKISLRSVQRCVQEANYDLFKSPRKQYKRKSKRLNTLCIETVRLILQEQYKLGEVPTTKHVFNYLKNNIGYTGSFSTVRRLLKNLEDQIAVKESTATTTTTNAFTPSTSDACFSQLTPLETVIIKEEVDVDEDYSGNSPKHSRSSSHVEFEETCNEETDPLEEKQYFSTNSNTSDIDFREVTTHQRRLPELVKPVKENHTSETEKTDKSSAQIQGLSNILRVADSLALNINNILSDDLCNFRDINPTHARRQTPRPSSNKESPLSDTKSKCTNLEQNLRIHYLKTMIKKEEELINLKIEINRVNLLKENMEMENNREAHLQRMENLKLEHELLKLVLENKKSNFC